MQPSTGGIHQLSSERAPFEGYAGVQETTPSVSYHIRMLVAPRNLVLGDIFVRWGRALSVARNDPTHR